MMKAKDFERIIQTDLKIISFQKKKYLFVKQLDESTSGTVGFVIASHRIPGVLFINPVVGVFHKQIEELYSKLTGRDTVKMCFPIISRPIGYLTSANEYMEWEYSEKLNIDEINADILDMIKKFGLPFIEKYRNQDDLLKYIKEGKYILSDSRDYRLPILYYLRGEKQKGLDAIEASLERQKKPIDVSGIPKFSSFFENVITVGGGNRTVDPEFLKFVEKYKEL